MDPCLHPNSEIRWRTISGGAKILQRQCVTCGAPIGSAISQKDKTPEQRESYGFWDEAPAKLKQARYEEAHAAREAGVVAHNADRLRENAEWWAWYNEYLRSPKWLYKRERVLERDGRLCQGCREATATQVHHLTYEHVGDEQLFELTSVCKSCHDRAHLRCGRGGPPVEQ